MINVKGILLQKSRVEVEQFIDVLSDLSDASRQVELIEDYAKERPLSVEDLAGFPHGMFRKDILANIVFHTIMKRSPLAGVSYEIYSFVYSSLAQNGLIDESLNHVSLHQYANLRPIVSLINQYGGLQYLIYGFPLVVENMSLVVPAINVTSALGDESCGSGLILPSKQEGFAIVITNRHVLEGQKIKDVRCGDRTFETISEPILHEEVDLAKFVVKSSADLPIVASEADAKVLDEVVSLGYPRVPTSAGQIVLAHRGEINGVVETFEKQRFLVISCNVSPGNSGGPIFNRYGACVGLVTRSATAEFGSADEIGGLFTSVYHMAIPADVVWDFASRTQ